MNKKNWCKLRSWNTQACTSFDIVKRPFDKYSFALAISHDIIQDSMNLLSMDEKKTLNKNIWLAPFYEMGGILFVNICFPHYTQTLVKIQ